METINTTTTQGKKISFMVDGVYSTKENKDELFDGEFNQDSKFFYYKETAETYYNHLKKLSPKVGTIGYADVFLFEEE